MIDAPLRAPGIQPGAYRELVRTFWQLSVRMPTSLLSQQVGKTEGALWKSWLIYAGFGLMVSIVAFRDPPREVYGAMVAGSAMFLIGLAVMADFAVFVMAPGDDEILFHQPVRSQTYLAARLTVAGMHVGLLALFYGLVPALVSLRWGEPLYGLLLPISLVAAAWFCLLLAFGIYRVAQSLLGGARLEALLTYLPAFFAVLTFLVPQALLGLMGRGGDADWTGTLDLLPPAWFSAWPEVALGNRDPHVLLRAGLGVLALPIGLWLLIAALGRGLLQDLLGAVANRGGSAARMPTAPLAHRLAATDPEAAAGYLLYRGAMRSRDSRTRTAPVLLMPIALVLMSFLQHVGGPFMITTALYALGAGAGTLVITGAYHEDHEAAWFYGTVPMCRYGRFLAGFLRAMMLRHLLPIFLLITLVLLLRDPGWTTLAGAVQAFAGGCISIPFLTRFLRDPPFSRQFQHAEQLAQVGIYLASMVLVGLMGAVHALVALLAPWAFVVTIPLTAGLLWVWMQRVLRGFDACPPWPISRSVPASLGS